MNFNNYSGGDTPFNAAFGSYDFVPSHKNNAPTPTATTTTDESIYGNIDTIRSGMAQDVKDGDGDVCQAVALYRYQVKIYK